jgi:hypothetical protein
MTGLAKERQAKQYRPKALCETVLYHVLFGIVGLEN